MYAIKWLALLLIFVGSASSADQPNVMLCPDDGCFVVTCDSEMCTIHHCQGGHCNPIWSYPKPDGGGSGESTAQSSSTTEQGQTNAVKPLFGPQGGGLNCGQQRCVIKTCSDSQCSVVGFDAGNSSILGSVENNDSLVEEIAKDFIRSNQDLSNDR